MVGSSIRQQAPMQKHQHYQPYARKPTPIRHHTQLGKFTTNSTRKWAAIPTTPQAPRRKPAPSKPRLGQPTSRPRAGTRSRYQQHPYPMAVHKMMSQLSVPLRMWFSAYATILGDDPEGIRRALPIVAQLTPAQSIFFGRTAPTDDDMRRFGGAERLLTTYVAQAQQASPKKEPPMHDQAYSSGKHPTDQAGNNHHQGHSHQGQPGEGAPPPVKADMPPSPCNWSLAGDTPNPMVKGPLPRPGAGIPA